MLLDIHLHLHGGCHLSAPTSRDLDKYDVEILPLKPVEAY